jgi:flagellar basal body P-ring protein FlgI
MPYDHPQYLVQGNVNLTCPATAASTDVVGAKFVAFANMKIKDVRGVVETAGTNTAAGYDILVGTTSSGDITHGTDTAGSVNVGSFADISVTKGQVVKLKTKANSATMVTAHTLTYQVDPGVDIIK